MEKNPIESGRTPEPGTKRKVGGGRSVARASIAVILALSLLSACSSGRFIDFNPGEREAVLDRSQAPFGLPDWGGADVATVYHQCLEIELEDISTAVLLAACSRELLSRHDVTEAQKVSGLERYNRALALIMDPLLGAGGDLRLAAAGIQIKLATGLSADMQVLLNADFRPQDERLQFETFGEIGIAGVMARENRQSPSDEFYPLEGIVRPVTFTLGRIEHNGSGWQVLVDSHQLNEPRAMDLGRQSYALAYSPGAAFLVLLNQANIDELSWTGLVQPAAAAARRGIFAIEALSDHKTPVLMIHGLNSDPLIWRYLTMEILNDAALHGRYQVWHAFYPSGPPPFYTSMMLRKKLSRLLARLAPVRQRDAFAVIGHSLGGIIAKTMVVDTGYSLWDATFRQRPDQLLREEGEQDIVDIFVFSPEFNNNTAFFLDTPHRGSGLADSLIGRIGSSLVDLPESFLELFRRFITRVGADTIMPAMLPYLENYGPNSVEVLRPGHPLLDEMNTLPIMGRAYSIIGSKDGAECSPPGACADISDGVVPYSSAHIDQAAEEIIVRSSHDSYRSEEAIQFILEKLRRE